MIKEIVKTINYKNSRNSEGSFCILDKHHIVFAYSYFYKGGGDNDPSHIRIIHSFDAGKTWTDDSEILVENEGKWNTMSVSFLKLKNSEILLGYIVKDSFLDTRYYVKRTKDMRKWTDPIEITKLSKPGYYVINNDRIFIDRYERILIPASYHECPDEKTFFSRGKCFIFCSEDYGNTWEILNRKPIESPYPHSEKHTSGLQEPGIVELKDGRFLMWARTDLGSQFFSYSFDKGKTWTTPQPSSLISPCSPASIKRIPETKDLLCVYNDHSGRFKYIKERRTPLVIAISKDEGENWEKHKIIEDNLEGRYCYTAIEFLDDKIFLAYNAGNYKTSVWQEIHICMVDLDFVYS